MRTLLLPLRASRPGSEKLSESAVPPNIRAPVIAAKRWPPSCCRIVFATVMSVICVVSVVSVWCHRSASRLLCLDVRHTFEIRGGGLARPGERVETLHELHPVAGLRQQPAPAPVALPAHERGQILDRD